MTSMKQIVLVGLAGSALFVVGCEEAKNKTADMAGKATAAAGDAAKKAGDAAGSAVDAAKGAAAGAADAAKGALEKVKAEGTKWLTDTVEKQWPEAKKSLESLAAKVPSISDAAKKTQAQGLVQELQGKIPQMEGLVGQLKNFKDGDFSKIFDQAKGMWDTFSTKLGDLKKLVG